MVGIIVAKPSIAALALQFFGALRAIRNSFPGFALGMNGEKVEQEPFPLLSRWAGKPSKHQQRGGYHAQPANKRKTEMSDTIETQNDDLFATVSFNGGGNSSRGTNRSRARERGTVAGGAIGGAIGGRVGMGRYGTVVGGIVGGGVGNGIAAVEDARRDGIHAAVRKREYLDRGTPTAGPQ